MRVLVIAQYFPPRRSTFSSRWSWLTTKLAEQGKNIQVVALLSATRQLGNLRHAVEADPPPDGVKIRPVLPVLQKRKLVGRAIAEGLSAVRAFGHGWRAGKVDVVVASAPTLVTIPLGWTLAKLRRVPLVLDLRDAWPELMDDWREWNDDGLRPRPLSLLERLAFPVAAAVIRHQILHIRRTAAAVVVTTEQFADDLRRRGVRRVRVIRNTSTKPWTSPLTLVPLEQDEFRVLYLGNVGRAQLLATAVKAAALATEQGTRLKLRIVGHGPQWEAAREIASMIGSPVEFVDQVPTYEVLDHYRWADSVLVMLRDWDSMRGTVPSKLYEAFLTGRHITASIAGETADLVRRFGAGDVVPPQDVGRLAQLWTELAADRSRLHRRPEGRRWVLDELHPDLLSKGFSEVLEEVTDA